MAVRSFYNNSMLFQSVSSPKKLLPQLSRGMVSDTVEFSLFLMFYCALIKYTSLFHQRLHVQVCSQVKPMHFIFLCAVLFSLHDGCEDADSYMSPSSICNESFF